MAPELLSSLKRKAQPAEAGSDDDRLEDMLLLNGVLSASEDDDDDDDDDGNSNDDESDVEEEEEILADKVPSDDGGLVPASQTTTKQPDSVVELNGHGQDRNGGEAGGGAGGDDADAEPADSPNYRITTSANGGVRYEYDEIDPVYDSDDSDAQGPANNTIGNIPLSFYDSYPHIGYDINGRKILRPATGEALDALLDSIEVPKGWTGLTDPETGKPLNLSQDELELLRRLQMNEVPEEGFDPYPEMVEYFTSIEEKMPLSAAPEPKRRFIPSKHEHRRIMKMVRAIRQGRILPYKPPEEVEREKAEAEAREGAGAYDLWANEQARELHVPHIPAPKLQAPGYDLSYNPPAEYLPTSKERDAWEAMDPEDREREYLPARFDALRRVPAYDGLVKERFERCLDLYLAPRIRRTRLNMDPALLLPKMPRPEELRPFPTTCQTVFRGHDGRVRSVSVSPDGLWLASGGDDGTVRVWAMNGHQEWAVRIGGAAEGAKRGEVPGAEPVTAVRWRPGADACVLAAASGEDVFFMVPPACGSAAAERAGREVLDAGFGYAQAGGGGGGGNRDREAKRDPPGRWARPGARLEAAGVLVKVTVRAAVKVISWHRRGDFFATTSPSGRHSSVAIHTISRHLTQIPFRRLAGLAQAAHFHPARPLLFVATQRSIRAYDLQRQELVRVLQPGARWISSFDIHPGGDNVIVGSYDRRLAWHDLDLSARPYRTMRFHTEAVRAARFHRGTLPLFADASDDGTVQVFHGRVVADLMENATIVPVKMLRGHRVVSRLGVLDLDWHPRHPWLVSGGADGTCRLWT